MTALPAQHHCRPEERNDKESGVADEPDHTSAAVRQHHPRFFAAAQNEIIENSGGNILVNAGLRVPEQVGKKQAALPAG